EIVEADRPVDREQQPRLAVAHVADVASRDHHASVRVQDETADPAAFRDHRLDRAIGRPAIDAAGDDVAEVEAPVPVRAGRFEEGVSPGDRLHGLPQRFVPGATSASIAVWWASGMRTSRARRLSSRCRISRTPTMADVTAGWRSVQAVA